MDSTEQLKAWGLAHAQARSAERAARQGSPTDDPADLRQRAKSLRDRADRLHREIYRSLGSRDRDTPR